MGMSRYRRTLRINGGKQLGSSTVSAVVRRGVDSGRIQATRHILREGERLDSLAGRFYGDASLWWVLAAASGIGWGLQVPPGTLIRVPNLDQVAALVG